MLDGFSTPKQSSIQGGVVVVVVVVMVVMTERHKAELKNYALVAPHPTDCPGGPPVPFLVGFR